MKSILKWFKNEAKMKRWMCVILIGLILACIGISKILITKIISFVGIAKVVALFVFGFTLVVIGITGSQKRILEILIEDTDYRMGNDKKNKNSKTLIFNKKVYQEGPNIVVIGGGSGLNTVLKGLKKYTNNITALVTVSSYGKDLNNSNEMPIDDIKESVIALSNDEETMRKLLEKNSKNNVTLGNMFFSAMSEIFGSFSESIEKTKNVFNMTGRVLPVTLNKMEICAELNDGTVVEEKSKIPEVVYDKVAKIERIYINPSNCIPAPGVLEAITNADAIIIGPGSLYTNVIPNLLIKNISKTIKESNAMKIYISNIMTEAGQTDNYLLSDHIKAIIEHAGNGIINYCICDSGNVVPEFVKIYNKRGQDIVEQDIHKCKELGVKVIEKNLSNVVGENIRHNTDEIAQSIIELVCEDLCFKNEHKSTKYVMLNSKLKNNKKSKKKNKPKKESNKPIKNNNTNKVKEKSKFQNKYKDRIQSIKDSDFKREQNKRLKK